MPFFQITRSIRKSVNLSSSSPVLETAKSTGMNISKTVDGLLAAEVKRRYWERWNEENKEAIDAYNARITREGLPLAKYRTWGKALGDGRTGPSHNRTSSKN